MPKNQFQKMVFAFLSVVITVHAYVFYSIYVVNGTTLMSVNGTNSVLDAVNAQGGIYMFGTMMPIWAVVLIEFCFAYTLECAMGQPYSFKLACRFVDPRKSKPIVTETAIICSTVILMVPSMSFLAACFYYPYYNGFSVLTLLANWLKLVCYNFPFALFTQIFLIQPIVRRVFGWLFKSRSKVAAPKAKKA